MPRDRASARSRHRRQHADEYSGSSDNPDERHHEPRSSSDDADQSQAMRYDRSARPSRKIPDKVSWDQITQDLIEQNHTLQDECIGLEHRCYSLEARLRELEAQKAEEEKAKAVEHDTHQSTALKDTDHGDKSGIGASGSMLSWKAMKGKVIHQELDTLRHQKASAVHDFERVQGENEVLRRDLKAAQASRSKLQEQCARLRVEAESAHHIRERVEEEAGRLHAELDRLSDVEREAGRLRKEMERLIEESATSHSLHLRPQCSEHLDAISAPRAVEELPPSAMRYGKARTSPDELCFGMSPSNIEDDPPPSGTIFGRGRSLADELTSDMQDGCTGNNERTSDMQEGCTGGAAGSNLEANLGREHSQEPNEVVASNARLRKQIAEREAELSRVYDQIEGFIQDRVETKRVRSQYMLLCAEVEEVRGLLANAKKEGQQLRERTNTLEREVLERDLHAAELSKMSKSEIAEKEAKKLTEEIEALRTALERQEEEARQQRERADTAEKDLADRGAQSGSKEDEVTQLKEELQMLQTAIEEDKQELQEQVGALEKEVVERDLRVQALRNLIEKEKAETRKLRTSFAENSNRASVDAINNSALEEEIKRLRERSRGAGPSCSGASKPD
eukprot:gnl/TRDRNA2_/TRDRNA2_147475_c0_seq1.p1 gnl/TRDRNA2_/TRDRNA2_147475_c0~~gnl/TRDRNA2_/TRDRNA2_147475_c0_seq1.p1  ORF type:complete len:622 (-),score=145.35 gnl/TRDRNA2_/TRDRNA2_147475_c0_seq1:347-2212(-)